MSSEPIKELTAEQAKLLPVYRDKWRDIGLSTAPCNHAKAEEAIRQVYTAADLAPPKVIIWCKSPFEGCIASEALGSLDDSDYGKAEDVVRKALSNKHNIKIKDVSKHLYSAGYGSHDAGWLCFYAYFRDVCKVEAAEKLSGLMALAEDCGWFWPFQEVVVLTEKPCKLYRDAGFRLHSTNSMAIEYPDGWGVYVYHGVNVSEDVIMRPETITVKQINEETNQELKRILVERYGLGRYITDSGAKELHRDDVGVLYQTEFGDDEPITMVAVKNSTPEPDGSIKDYFLRVPNDTKTARGGIAWTFGMTEEEYYPQVET